MVLTIVGLALGFAAATLVALYVYHESRYDNYQPNVERTYRVTQHHVPTGDDFPLMTPRAEQYLKKIAGVEDAFFLIRTQSLFNSVMKVGDSYFKLKNLYAATPNINDFMRIEVLHGDLNKVLKEADYLALSESESIRIFGNTDSVGQTVLFEQYNVTLTIGAVFKDLTHDTHFAVSSLLSAEPFLNSKGSHSYTYLRLAESTDISQVESEITKILADIWKWNPKDLQFYLRPLLDIHLTPNLNDMKKGGSFKTLSIAIVLTLLLLVISSINYINMSIAQAGLRAKEVGIRKVLGATRLQLVLQFLSESILVAMIAAFLACVLVKFSLPQFNELVGRKIEIDNWGDLILYEISTTAILGILSGLYPALFISSLRTKRVLSGDMQKGKTANLVRQILMTFQAGLSIALIIGSAELYTQLNYLNNLPVNYERSSQIKVLDPPGDLIYSDNRGELFNDLARIEGVVSATPADFAPTKATYAGISDVRISGVDSFTNEVAFGGVGFDAVKTLGLELVAGRDFSSQYLADWYNSETNSASIMIPESLLNSAGYSSAEDALGQQWVFSAGGSQNIKGTIVAVFRDIKIGSARGQSLPVVLTCGLSGSGVNSIVIKVDNPYSPTVQADIVEFMESRFNMNPVELEVMEQLYNSLYDEENRLLSMVAIFSAFAVLLTCVGIFGLAAFSAQRRRREVAVRKVLGASRVSLVALLSKETLILVTASLFIAYPLAYLVLDDWLNRFTYRIDQSFSFYVGAFVFVLFITCLTISVIAFRTASERPSSVLSQD